MAEDPARNAKTGNALIDALPGSDRTRISDASEEVTLRMRDTLFTPGSFVRDVYFPLSGTIVSIITVLSDGVGVEMATIGREGTTGANVFLGDARVTNIRAVCQVPGAAMRISADVFREESQHGPFLEVMQRYTLTLLNQAAQLVACNRLHSTEERCARWLLTTHDRMASDTFPMTQEFLSEMLGVRRPSVTIVAATLQRAGLISYSRGIITITDREGLERASCECYGVFRDEFLRLIEG